MTRSLRSEITLMSQVLFKDQADIEFARSLAAPLEIKIISFDEDKDKFLERRRFYDLTGLIVRRELLEEPGIERVDLPDDYVVRVLLAKGEGNYILSFSRKRVSASNPHQLIVNMLIFGSVFTLIAFIYLRNQLRPITRLANAAEAFGLGQSVQYRPSGAVEVRAAGEAFLDMRARIERHIEQRTLLLSGVSHDLRTPLTRLRLGLSMLEVEEKVDLEKDVTEMQALIDEFLSFARNQADTGSNTEQADIWEIVDDVVKNISRNSGRVSFVKPYQPLFLELRPLAIRRALENLIGNGLRYANKVSVSASVYKTEVHVTVEDDGPGIPDEQIEEALKPFSRLDPARNQNRGSGVGLGLPIVADVAYAHGGKLELSKSVALGGLKADLIVGLQEKF
jgi:two-component system osmolarity sensor histidine kinase EnvZ